MNLRPRRQTRTFAITYKRGLRWCLFVAFSSRTIRSAITQFDGTSLPIGDGSERFPQRWRLLEITPGSTAPANGMFPKSPKGTRIIASKVYMEVE